MTGRTVQPWEAPVVRALDEIETLPGFEPDRIRWRSLQFAGAGPRMDTVSIRAFLRDSDGADFVRFTATDEGFFVTGPWRTPLRPSGVARALQVPTGSAELAMLVLGVGQEAALGLYNRMHAPDEPHPHRFPRHLAFPDLETPDRGTDGIGR